MTALFDFLCRLLWPAGPGAMRLWLALVVVVHHVTRIEIGKAPVLVFFALSGYWIHRMWHERYARSLQPYVTFIVSRWWRLAPMMVLSSVLAILALIVVGQHTHLASIAASPFQQVLAAVSGLGAALLPDRPVGPTWSLDVEMQFYLVAPVLVWAVKRLGSIAALAGAFIVQQIGLMIWPEVSLPAFVIWFVAGMVAAERAWVPSKRLASAGLVASVSLVLGTLLSPLYATFLAPDAPDWTPLNIVAGVLALPFALRTVANKGDKVDAMMADQSYVVYLMHWPAIILYRHIEWASEAERMVGLLGLAAATGVACFFAWTWIDRPLNRRRSAWVADRCNAATTPLSPGLLSV